MLENLDDLATIITLENGKALGEAKGEIKYAASVFTIRQPVGVCGIICPWNFPSAMITRKAAAALAVGCTVVIKPDSQTPLSALAMAYLAEKGRLSQGFV
ncbi:BEM_collapsed_G0002170.mRNA.1.CDS.1 [Saccharomyces cerevisiae]|nr:BEM_collapsed_G0002170.mRNA.1.CDS.1 [Saccharomyces cerevisiae]